MKNFKQLKIWQLGLDIAKQSLSLTAEFPHYVRYSLGDQINRSSISIASNIAEGSSRQSDKEYFRYVEIALGSTFELETQLLIAQSTNLGSVDKIESILRLILQEQSMLNAFAKRLKTSIKYNPGL